MIAESNPARFTLRKEYFGGFVYDSQSAKHELLSPEEYSIVTSLQKASDGLLKQAQSTNPEFLQRLKVFKKFGFIDQSEDGRITLVNMRIVNQLEDPPQGMLSAPIRVFDTYTKKCNFDFFKDLSARFQCKILPGLIMDKEKIVLLHLRDTT